MFTEDELEIIAIALDIYLADLSEEATYREIFEVEVLVNKVDNILNPEEVF